MTRNTKRVLSNKARLLQMLIILLSILVVGTSIALVVIGVKYKHAQDDTANLHASASALQSQYDELENKNSVENSENSVIIESYQNQAEEQNSIYASEKESLNQKIAELNQQIAIKKKQQTAPPPQNINGEGKTVYLTFDDGPSKHTPEILRILQEQNVRATFFVMNRGGYNHYMKDIVDAGHVIALHTYTHDYATVYASDEAYFKDLQQISDLVYEETGQRSKIIRFPGGSSNTVSRKYCPGIMTRVTAEVERQGYRYYDWNVNSTDASGNNVPVDTLLANCKKVPKSNTVIVLMHDTNAKRTTVEALPSIIAYYKSIGCTFAAIDENTPPIHQKIGN